MIDMDDPEFRRLVYCYKGGCRDEECRSAHRVYEREMKRRRNRPDSGWESPYVDEATRREVIRHLNKLSAANIGWRRLHELTGLAGSTINQIKNGKRVKITKRVANLILGVGVHRVRPRRLPPHMQPSPKVDSCSST